MKNIIKLIKKEIKNIINNKREEIKSYIEEIDKISEEIKKNISEYIKSSITEDYSKYIINIALKDEKEIKELITQYITHKFIGENNGLIYHLPKPLPKYSCGFYCETKILDEVFISDTRINKYKGKYKGREMYKNIKIELNKEMTKKFIQEFSIYFIKHVLYKNVRTIKFIISKEKQRTPFMIINGENNVIKYSGYKINLVLINANSLVRTFFEDILSKRYIKKTQYKIYHKGINYYDQYDNMVINYYDQYDNRIIRHINKVYTINGRQLSLIDIKPSVGESEAWKDTALGIINKMENENKKSIIKNIISSVTDGYMYILYYILNERNEEAKRSFVEKLGGWEEVLPHFGELISEGNDGKHPIKLYKIGNLKFILVTDHSTDRQYALAPPNQETNDAKEAWLSTFPCKISYRQGDVGITKIAGEGLTIDETQTLKKKT